MVSKTTSATAKNKKHPQKRVQTLQSSYGCLYMRYAFYKILIYKISVYTVSPFWEHTILYGTPFFDTPFYEYTFSPSEITEHCPF